MKTSLLVLGSLVLSGTACVHDTCNGGRNMTAPHVVRGIELDPDGGSYFRVAWEPGTERGAGLPASYFVAARPEATNWIRAVSPTAAARELRVDVDAAALSASTSPDFTLVFPDRRGYLACQHPASPDRYTLSGSLGLDGGTASQLEERFMPGGF